MPPHKKATPEERELGRRIRFLRTRMGRDAQEFARQVGLARSYLWKLEEKGGNIGYDLLSRIAKELNMTPAQFLAEDIAPPPKWHVLKSWPALFEAVEEGRKTFDVRIDDGRGFSEGDFLVLCEWVPQPEVGDLHYTGRKMKLEVTYVLGNLEDFGVTEGEHPVVVMAVRKTTIALPDDLVVPTSETEESSVEV